MDTVPAKTLTLETQGRNLDGPRLADSLGTGDTLLVFLRHLG